MVGLRGIGDTLRPRCGGLLVGLLALTIAPFGALAQDAQWSWFAWNNATGDWGGVRQDLIEAGITPSLSYGADFLANPIGGQEQESAYSAGLYASLNVDLQTLVGLKGTSLFMSGIWDQGRDLSGDSIGNFFDVSNTFNGRSLRAAQIYLRQQLWDGDFDFAVGRISAGDDFAASDLYAYYVSAAINSNPQTLESNTQSFTIAPLVQWGARVSVTPAQGSHITVGSYLANPGADDDNGRGLNFTLDPSDGVLAVAEYGHENPLEGLLTALPGQIRFGGYYDFADFPILDDPATEESGSFGLYLAGEQMIYREDARSTQGLTTWAAFTFAPQKDINAVPFAAYGGALYRGLAPTRPSDVTALGLYYADFSERLVDQSYEFVVEANHRFQLAPWLYITPDMQYVVNPNGGAIPNALVVGAELGIGF